MIEARGEPPFLVLGYAAGETTDESRRHMTEFAMMVGLYAGVDIAVSPLPSYDRVTQLIHKGKLDLAWVSPIPYIALVRNDSVVPLVSPYRGGTNYHGAIIVSASSNLGGLASLQGKRAAWVDRYSAAGFVIPRLELVTAGLDVRTAFASQRFYGTHEAVARAVATGAADFGATFVRRAPSGAVVSGPWSAAPEIEASLRIFATFGEIPPDVIAAAAALNPAVRERIRRAMLSLSDDLRGQQVLSAVFGADALREASVDGYEALREAALVASQEHLLDVEERIDPSEISGPDRT
jgi:phosphate/phosphite/phosphonate ABC transporter binding protein